MPDTVTIKVRNTKLSASEGFGSYVRKLSVSAFRGGEIEGRLHAYLIDIPRAHAEGSFQAVADLMEADMELDDLCQLAYGAAGGELPGHFFDSPVCFTPSFLQSAMMIDDQDHSALSTENPFAYGFILVTHVSVSSSCQNRGIGSSLLRSMTRYSDRAAYVALRASPFLECWDDSLFQTGLEQVTRFYSRLGFVPLGNPGSLWMLNRTDKIGSVSSTEAPG